jgi:hypothetical protein
MQKAGTNADMPHVSKMSRDPSHNAPKKSACNARETICGGTKHCRKKWLLQTTNVKGGPKCRQEKQVPSMVQTSSIEALGFTFGLKMECRLDLNTQGLEICL